MVPFQILLLIIGIIVIAWCFKEYNDEKLNLGLCLVVTVIVLLVLIASFFPQISVELAELLGLGRGLDLLYVIAMIILLFITFKLYNMVEDQKRRINNLISQLAIQNHEDKKQ